MAKRCSLANRRAIYTALAFLLCWAFSVISYFIIKNQKRFGFPSILYVCRVSCLFVGSRNAFDNLFAEKAIQRAEAVQSVFSSARALLPVSMFSFCSRSVAWCLPCLCHS